MGVNPGFQDRGDERRPGWPDTFVAYKAYIPVSENFTLDEIRLWPTQFGRNEVVRRSGRSYVNPQDSSPAGDRRQIVATPPVDIGLGDGAVDNHHPSPETQHV